MIKLGIGAHVRTTLYTNLYFQYWSVILDYLKCSDFREIYFITQS